MTSNTEGLDHNLGAVRLVDGNRVHRTRRHAPGFVALQAGVRSVAGLLIKHADANQTFRRLKRTRLYPGTSQFALDTTSASVGNDSERLSHVILLKRHSRKDPQPKRPTAVNFYSTDVAGGGNRGPPESRVDSTRRLLAKKATLGA